MCGSYPNRCRGRDRNGVIQHLQHLRSIVGEPSELTARKMYDHLNQQATDFISRSPFLILSTVDAQVLERYKDSL